MSRGKKKKVKHVFFFINKQLISKRKKRSCMWCNAATLCTGASGCSAKQQHCFANRK